MRHIDLRQSPRFDESSRRVQHLSVAAVAVLAIASKIASFVINFANVLRRFVSHSSHLSDDYSNSDYRQDTRLSLLRFYPFLSIVNFLHHI